MSSQVRQSSIGDLAEHGREVLEVRRLPHADLGEQLVGLVRRGAEVGDVDVPVEGGAELAELGEGLEVVGLLDVAGLGALPVAGGQLGVDLEHRARPGLRVVPLAGVDQPQHRRQVGDVRLADRGELLVAVVGLVRQPEATLHQVEQVAVGVAVVGVDVGAEQPVAAEPLELAEERRHVADVAQRRDRVDQRLDRPGAEPVDPLGVHERREQVADLLRVGVQLGRLVAVRGDLGQVLDDRVDLLLGHVGQLHERPPAGPVRRDVGLVQPAAVDVAEQVVLRPDVGVHALAGVVQDAHAIESIRAAASGQFHRVPGETVPDLKELQPGSGSFLDVRPGDLRRRPPSSGCRRVVLDCWGDPVRPPARPDHQGAGLRHAGELPRRAPGHPEAVASVRGACRPPRPEDVRRRGRRRRHLHHLLPDPPRRRPGRARPRGRRAPGRPVPPRPAPRRAARRLRRIGPGFDELESLGRLDRTRPLVEFYKRHDEIELWLPVTG